MNGDENLAMMDMDTEEVKNDMTLPVSILAKPRSLLVFFLLAFGISWVVWIPAALASHGFLSFRPGPSATGLLGAFGPSTAALITTAIFDGKAGFRSLLRRLLTWRVGLHWYLFVLFWPVLLSLAKTALAVMFETSLPDFAQPPFVHLYPLPSELSEVNPLLFLPFVFLQQTLIGSSMGEEIGWRGYALPRLEAHRNALQAGVILGIVWAVSHLPLWLTKGHPLTEQFLGWTMLGTENPEYVVVGDNRSRFDFDHLNHALRLLLRGARLIGMNPDLVDNSTDAPELNVGSWVRLLEAASGAQAVYVGKPQPFAFELALADMGLNRKQVLMVGDRVESDIRMEGDPEICLIDRYNNHRVENSGVERPSSRQTRLPRCTNRTGPSSPSLSWRPLTQTGGRERRPLAACVPSRPNC